MKLELVKTFIEYHIDMTRRVWDSINEITDEEFLADDAYSRGSIRNLMVHIASTDRRWLAGLKNLEDVGHLKFEDFPTKSTARELFETVARDFSEYIAKMTAEELEQTPPGFSQPRSAVLLHLVNHGTDHRSTVLQKLTELSAPTFDQDYILWLRDKK